MVSYISVNTAWGMKKQSAFGTPATPVDVFIPFISEGLEKSREKIEIIDSENRHAKENTNPMGRVKVAGDIETHVESVNVGYPLYFLMGSTSFTADSPAIGVHTHTFEVADTLPYFTQEIKYGTSPKGKQAQDNLMKSVTFDLTDTSLNAQWGTVGADMNPSVTATAPVFPTGKRFTYKDLNDGGTVNFKVTPGSGSPVEVKLKRGSLTLDNGVNEDEYIQGFTTVQQLDAGKFVANGSFELSYSTGTDLDAWFDGTERGKIVFAYKGNVVALGEKEEIRFEIPNAWVLSAPVTQTNNETVTRQVNFEAFYSASSTPKSVKISLINSKSGLYSA